MITGYMNQPFIGIEILIEKYKCDIHHSNFPDYKNHSTGCVNKSALKKIAESDKN